MNKIFFLFCAVVLAGCYRDNTMTVKDLGETMYDLRVYQENLGDELKAGRLNEAVWLLDGMDSVLTEITKKFREHRKLEEPFSYYYKVKMKKPVQMIRRGIRKGHTSLAMNGYRMLVNKCNSCHTDNNIDKDVNF